MEWRPIETAPKDGVIVVSDGDDVSVGWWYGEKMVHWLPAGGEPAYWMHLPEAHVVAADR